MWYNYIFLNSINILCGKCDECKVLVNENNI